METSMIFRLINSTIKTQIQSGTASYLAITFSKSFIVFTLKENKDSTNRSNLHLNKYKKHGKLAIGKTSTFYNATIHKKIHHDQSVPNTKYQTSKDKGRQSS